MSESPSRLLTALLVGNTILTLAVAGWGAWAVADPEYWFPDAFAEEGPRGDQGPRGDRGPRGPQGPPGDTGADADEALTAIGDVQSQVDELASRVDNLEGIDPYTLDSRLSDVEGRIDSACSTLTFELIASGC